MSDEPEVENTRLTIHMGATVDVGVGDDHNWAKPAASFSTQWKGIPTAEQVRLAFQFSQQEIIAPVLEELIVQITDRQALARKKRR